MSFFAVEELSKSFGGLMAVSDLSFSMEEGSVTGLIGPNGAGKTTVFNLITGNYRPDQGRILFNGKNLAGLPMHAIVSLGIARTFQSIRLFQKMSVLENVLAGTHCRTHSGIVAAMFRFASQKREEQEAVQNAMTELAFVGLENLADKRAGSLSYGQQRLLEIARALATRPRLLILDEPAGGMNDKETKDLIVLIERLQERGISILLIEHDMRLVMRVCARLVVLEHGMLIADGEPKEIRNLPRVIEAYLGPDEAGVCF